MSDAPDLTPEQDAVRRLLAEARHDGPTPPEVVARLDDALAALVAERQETAAGPTAPVVDLAARRRRTAGIGLLAAAAVVVAGVAIGQGLPERSGGNDSAAGSAAEGDMSTAQEPEGSDDSGGADGGSSDSQLAPEALKSTVPSPAAGYPTLSTLAGDLDGELLDLRSTDPERSAEPGVPDALVTCDLAGVGPGRRVAAEVDGQAGAVVFRRPSGDVQDVAIYVCGDAVPVRTLTLPAP